MERFDFADFRGGWQPNYNAAFSEVLCAICFSDDLEEVQYRFDMSFATTGDSPERDYTHLIPSSVGVGGVSANDSQGGLQFELGAASGGKTPLKIEFREEIPPGGDYSFTFNYKIPNRALIDRELFHIKMMFNDFFAFDVACERLRFELHPPRGFVTRSTVPTVDLTHNPIYFEYSKLRQVEPFSLMAVTEKRGVTSKAVLWFGSVLGSGAIGALLTALL